MAVGVLFVRGDGTTFGASHLKENADEGKNVRLSFEFKVKTEYVSAVRFKIYTAPD